MRIYTIYLIKKNKWFINNQKDNNKLVKEER